MGTKCLDLKNFEDYKYTNAGIYLIYTHDKNFFKQFPIYPQLSEFLPELKEYKPDKYLLYIGSACKSIPSRIGAHISGDVCDSTLRRILGVLMGYKFFVRNQKFHLAYREKGVQKHQIETEITNFIKANLFFEVMQLPDYNNNEWAIQRHEYDLIAVYNPVLNVGHVNDKFIMKFHKKLNNFTERLYADNS